MAALSAKTSLVEWKNLRFLIMDAPKDTNLHLYLKECKKNNVTQIVRISEPSYSKDEVEKAGIGLNVRRRAPPPFLSYWAVRFSLLTMFSPHNALYRKCFTKTARALLQKSFLGGSMSFQEPSTPRGRKSRNLASPSTVLQDSAERQF